MIGLTQRGCLTVTSILDHAARHHGTRRIASIAADGAFSYDYASLDARVRSLAAALRFLGVGPGDRVASLAWNTHRHLELMFAVPAIGAILHTVNPRFSEAQIGYVLDHAGGTLLFVDDDLMPLAERVNEGLSRKRSLISLANRTGAANYEALLAAHAPMAQWPKVEEETGAVLCYTSGTTGDPKGVLYSHRGIVLHALATSAPGVFDVSPLDVLMPCASMYHATAWGWPYVAAMNGAGLALPGARFEPDRLAGLVRAEGVTITGGVPTIFTQLLSHLDDTGGALPTLKRVFIGGSACPPSLYRGLPDRYGVDVRQLWGMTETGPIGSVASATAAFAATGQAVSDTQGRPLYGCEILIRDEAGAALPHDGVTPGRLMVRGPWVIRRYFGQDQDAADDDGWFDSGDIATVDAHSFMRLVDRAKDVIKSGGEWISSVALENAATLDASVRAAAVVGVAHPKWEERPLLIVELHRGTQLDRERLLKVIAGQVAHWWLPDDVVEVERLPLTATGKIDKRALKAFYRDHLLPRAHEAAA